MSDKSSVLQSGSAIRAFLLEAIHQKFNASSIRTVAEMGLMQGGARIDLAVINGHLHGYEIKSDADSLSRLPHQIDSYGKVFDRVTLVTGGRHLKRAEQNIPHWWGITLVLERNSIVKFRSIRRGRKNPQKSKEHLAQLLWKEELVALLTSIHPQKKYNNKPKRELWAQLISSMNTKSFDSAILQTLKSRTNWRPEEPQKSHDD